MAAADVEIVRRAWAAVPRGDAEAFRAFLHPDVRWYGAGEEEGGCHDRDQAVAYIERALENGVTGEATEVRDCGEHVLAIVQTRHPQDWGEQPTPHGEVVTVRDGLIARMVVFPDVATARAAAARRDPASGSAPP